MIHSYEILPASTHLAVTMLEGEARRVFLNLPVEVQDSLDKIIIHFEVVYSQDAILGDFKTHFISRGERMGNSNLHNAQQDIAAEICHREGWLKGPFADGLLSNSHRNLKKNTEVTPI